jgi:predicted glycoside hydrolase/deacetylase ChbG (UPF0249 family)
VSTKRYLIVTADDYGMGPETSRGILDLATRGVVTSTVLLVNSPHAESGINLWRQRGMPVEMGWHPCVTLDGPVADPERVSSLLDGDGRFWSLGQFLRRLFLGQIQELEILVELRAQYDRFCDLVGQAPTMVNAHHHVHVFEPVGTILAEIMAQQTTRPFVRCVRESWHTLWNVPGGRIKRAFLSALGKRAAGRMLAAGYPGNDALAGVTDPHCVADPAFLARWLDKVQGRVVELTCHPGYHDEHIVGRDCLAGDIQHLRRERELRLLFDPSFGNSCTANGFTLLAPSEWLRMHSSGGLHAA